MVHTYKKKKIKWSNYKTGEITTSGDGPGTGKHLIVPYQRKVVDKTELTPSISSSPLHNLFIFPNS